MNENNLFKEPKLINRIDGSLPKENSIIGKIESVFDFMKIDSFHFFTKNLADNDKNCVIPLIWKVLLLKKNNYKINIKKELINFIGKKNLLENMTFYEKYSLKLQYIVFYDDIDWGNTNQKLFVIDVIKKENKIKLKIKLLTKIEFENYLYSIQNEDMIMNKPLIYSQTNLEKYLSDQCQRQLNPIKRAIFPGDVDCLICKNQKYNYLIEFKKHTIKGSIEEQSFKKYWYKDRKKYTGLALLAKYLCLNYFINFIYSTNEDKNKIKLEIIDTNLNLIISKIIVFNDKEELKHIIFQLFNK